MSKLCLSFNRKGLPLFSPGSQAFWQLARLNLDDAGRHYQAGDS